jgi:flagellar hook-associated protein 3 FlgL
MKVATNQYFNELTRVLTDQHAEIATLQAKMAKGDKLLRPSEDPGVALKILDLKSLMSRQDSQATVLRDLDSRLVMEETAISGMRDIFMRIQELTVMGANDTYSLANRKVIAAEIRGYKSQLMNLANTRHTDGGYLFAGTKNTNPPFQNDGTGGVTYQGDSTRVYLKGAGDQQLEINTTGFELFSGGSTTRDRSLDATLVFAEIESLALVLESGDQSQISAKIGSVDELRGNLELALTKIGVRRNVIEAQTSIVQEQSTMLQGLLSDQKDLDYTAAITMLSARMLALEAAQSTVSKISQLNLFNYLR